MLLSTFLTQSFMWHNSSSLLLSFSTANIDHQMVIVNFAILLIHLLIQTTRKHENHNHIIYRHASHNTVHFSSNEL